MKLLLLFLINVVIGFAEILEGDSNQSSRFITVYSDEDGHPELVDTWAPLPEPKATESDVTLYLYTRSNPDEPQILPLDVKAFKKSIFKRKKLNVFVIHGWYSDWETDCNKKIRDAFLQVSDVNVFVVDWSGPAGGAYTRAFVNVPVVGGHLGNFITELQNKFKLKASNFLLTGFSLGAHVAGCAGAAAGGNVQSIVGLDPAGPLFVNAITSNRLDPTDAEFVQVIHTNDGFLGNMNDLGHVDIRPNGGRRQPGCGVDIVGMCAHRRSYLYYVESLVSGGFTSWLCNSYLRFSLNLCDDNEVTNLGGLVKDRNARGRYYLDTNSESPFSQK